MTTLHLRVRQHGRLGSIRGIDVESIEQAATVSRVPGCQFGMALVRGQIIPVLRLGDVDGCLVVGRVRGEVLGIVGLDVVGFDLEETVLEETSAASNLDLAGVAYWQEPMDPNCQAGADLDIDVDALIARAKLQQRQPSLPSEEIS
jgi:hypothetical protein